MPASLHFYRDLPKLESFSLATESRLHADVPDDWWVVIADVAGSTKEVAPFGWTECFMF
jgi:hypothetical protein